MITRELTELERIIIQQMSITTPFTFDEVENVYRCFNSFDDTIKHAEWCCGNGIGLFEETQLIETIKKSTNTYVLKDGDRLIINDKAIIVNIGE